jgi:hypothetical protein
MLTTEREAEIRKWIADGIKTPWLVETASLSFPAARDLLAELDETRRERERNHKLWQDGTCKIIAEKEAVEAALAETRGRVARLEQILNGQHDVTVQLPKVKP